MTSKTRIIALFVLSGVVLAGTMTRNFGNGRSGTLKQNQKAKNPKTGKPATELKAEVATTRSGDVGIRKQWQKWEDADGDGKIDANEWKNVGKSETTTQGSSASANNPLTNKSTIYYTPSAATNLIKKGGVVRVCIQFQEWTDANGDGDVDPGETVWTDPEYIPETGGEVVLPPAA